MMKKLFSIILAFATCVNAFSHKAIQESAPEWYKRFMAPAPETYPWTFWYWMYGCVSDEGIKLDLEAMHDAGIAGFYLMPIKTLRTARDITARHANSRPNGGSVWTLYSAWQTV